MIPVGIFNGYFPYALKEQAERISALGFNTVQLDLQFKGMDFSTGAAVHPDKAHEIRETFRDHGLPVSCLSGYTNIIHPDADRRKANLDRLKAILKHARAFGSPYVLSETGTFDTTSDWVSHPKNRTEEGFAECRKVIRELCDVAEDHGSVFVMETYVNNVIGSIEETLRIFAEVDSPALALVMDPTNYFEDHNIDRMDETLRAIFDALGDRIVIAHAKDVKRSGDDKSEKHAAIDATEAHSFRGVGEMELPAPGLGSLNYDAYLTRLSRRHPNMPLIIEHLEEDDVPRAFGFIRDTLRKHGI